MVRRKKKVDVGLWCCLLLYCLLILIIILLGCNWLGDTMWSMHTHIHKKRKLQRRDTKSNLAGRNMQCLTERGNRSSNLNGHQPSDTTHWTASRNSAPEPACWYRTTVVMVTIIFSLLHHSWIFLYKSEARKHLSEGTVNWTASSGSWTGVTCWFAPLTNAVDSSSACCPLQRYHIWTPTYFGGLGG